MHSMPKAGSIEIHSIYEFKRYEIVIVSSVRSYKPIVRLSVGRIGFFGWGFAKSAHVSVCSPIESPVYSCFGVMLCCQVFMVVGF